MRIAIANFFLFFLLLYPFFANFLCLALDKKRRRLHLHNFIIFTLSIFLSAISNSFTGVINDSGGDFCFTFGATFAFFYLFIAIKRWSERRKMLYAAAFSTVFWNTIEMLSLVIKDDLGAVWNLLLKTGTPSFQDHVFYDLGGLVAVAYILLFIKEGERE